MEIHKTRFKQLFLLVMFLASFLCIVFAFCFSCVELKPAEFRLTSAVTAGDGLQSGQLLDYDSRDDYNEETEFRTFSNTLASFENSSKRLPTALIIGAKKSGTRALLEFLRIHPDVRATGPEVHFFDKNYEKGLEWYRQQMPPTLPGQLTMEKTPSYFITKDAPRRVHAMSPKTKLIIVVRDPVTRALSDYAQASTRHLHGRSFEDMAFIDIVAGIVNTSWGAIKVGIYSKHIVNWLKYFRMEQIHIVSCEAMIKNPAKVMSDVQVFLNITKFITQEHFFFNETKGFPCVMKGKNNTSPHCLGDSKGRRHPLISRYAIERLLAFYKPFNEKLYQITGHYLGWP